MKGCFSAPSQGHCVNRQCSPGKCGGCCADPKSHALVENFGGQWLQFRGLESAHPDINRFAKFDDYIRMSMRQETERFFENLMREDRSILDFLNAKYTFLNQALAQFYGIKGVQGPEFRQSGSDWHAPRRCIDPGSVLPYPHIPLALQWCCAGNGYWKTC